jgi:hypothetical protein
MYSLYKDEYTVQLYTVEVLQEGDWGRKEKNGTDEPIQDIIHMEMEMS